MKNMLHVLLWIMMACFWSCSSEHEDIPEPTPLPPTPTPEFNETVERTALIALYEATDGDNWKNNANWCSDKPIKEWYGITFKGNLYELNLNDNNLKGCLPDEIGNLKALKNLTLSHNKIEGEIPDTIWSLPFLMTLKLNANLLTGSISSTIVKAQKLEYLDLMNNHLTGEIPNAICDLVYLKELRIGNGGDPNMPIYQYNLFTGSIPQQIGKLFRLKYLDITTCGLTGTIPESFYDLKALDTFCASNYNPIKELQEETSPYLNRITGTISENISALKNLLYFCIGHNNITGNIPKGFAALKKLKSLQLYYNKMSGKIPEEITSSSMWNKSGWNPDSWILPQQKGYGFTFNFYESTDYSKDGQVRVLQTATKGKGIDIVLMGDGYSDKSINNGTYDEVMNLTKEKLFTIEPVKSFREMFNVYAVTAVSKNEGYEPGTETAFSVKFASGSGKFNISHDSASYKYAHKAINDVNEAVMVIIVNHTGTTRSVCFMSPTNESVDYGSGTSRAYCNRGNNEKEFERTLHHEVWGHGFAKLADEYVEFNCAPSAYEIQEVKKKQLSGWWKNIDFTDDTSQIRWKHFIYDSRYEDEKLGAYEGGYTYAKDVWRPTESSVMRSGSASFNAPSREAIYYRIHKLAYGDNWKYDYEEFVKYDEINRNAASRAAVEPLTEAEQQEYIKNHCPPIILNDTWRDAMNKGKKDIVVPLR